MCLNIDATPESRRMQWQPSACRGVPWLSGATLPRCSAGLAIATAIGRRWWNSSEGHASSPIFKSIQWLGSNERYRKRAGRGWMGAGLRNTGAMLRAFAPKVGMNGPRSDLSISRRGVGVAAEDCRKRKKRPVACLLLRSFTQVCQLPTSATSSAPARNNGNDHDAPRIPAGSRGSRQRGLTSRSA